MKLLHERQTRTMHISIAANKDLQHFVSHLCHTNGQEYYTSLVLWPMITVEFTVYVGNGYFPTQILLIAIVCIPAKIFLILTC